MVIMAMISSSTNSNKKHRPCSQSADNRWTLLVCVFLSLPIIYLLQVQGLAKSRMAPASSLLDLGKNNDTTTSTPSISDNRDPLSCEVLLRRLKSARHDKILLVAMDFDETILDIHTGGRWKQDPSLLVPHVRPSFQCFINHLLQQQPPLFIAITTFSNQKELIRQVLGKSLMMDDSTNQDSKTKKNDSYDYSTIPIFGGDDWVKGHSKGKQSQLLLAMQHYNARKNSQTEEITPSNTLLIDDDANNIKVARKDGYQTLLYLPTRVHGS
jgi:hypothetical protein